MPDEINLALFAGVIPGAVALMTLWLAWKRSAKVSQLTGPTWLVPALLGFAFVLGTYPILGIPALWPASVSDRYPHAVVLIALFGLIEGIARTRAGRAAQGRGLGPARFNAFALITPAWRAIAFAAAFWVLIAPMAGRAVPWAQFFAWGLAIAVGGGAVATIVDRVVIRLPGWLGAGVLALVAFSAAPLLFFADFAIGAQVFPSFAAVMVSALLVALVNPRLTVACGGVTVFVGGLLVMITAAGLHNEPPTTVVGYTGLVLLGVSPVGLAMALLVRHDGRAKEVGMAVVATIALLGVSAGAITQSHHSSGDDDDSYEQWGE